MERLLMKYFVALAAVLITLCGVSVVTADLNTVPWKGTVFIGEEGLDITAPMQAGSNITHTTLSYFGSGGDPAVDAPEYTLTGVNAGNFYVSPSIFEGRTGAWYVTDGTPTLALYAESTSASIRVWNIETQSDVTGKSVPRDTVLDFKIDTNLYQIQQRDTSADFDFDIEVRNPDGTTYDRLATQSGLDQSLENLPVDSSLYYWASQSPAFGWALNAEAYGDRIYETGEYRVKVTCDQNNLNVDSVERTVTIASETLKIETPSDEFRVTRGSSFTVTITGQPNTYYYLFVDSTQTKPAPIIALNQKNVERGIGGDYITEDGKRLDNSVPKDVPSRYYARVKLDSNGELAVGFQTTKDTDDKRYTLRVETKIGGAYKSDETTVSVSEGTVTLGAEGSGTYYMGDQIKLSGTSTEGNTIYLFVTGPNLPSVGGKLTDPSVAVSNGNDATFNSADLDEDDEYDFTWRTENIGIDSGTYTIYAVSTPNDKNHLADTAYATFSLSLRKPYLSAQSESYVANGDKLIITGSAGTEVSEGIAIWIFGKNYATRDIAEVNSDTTFKYELDRGVTQDLASGQYYVVVQHPMYNNQFDVTLDGNYVVDQRGDDIFKIRGSGSLMGSDAAYALVDAINDADIDDIYTNLQFFVDAPTITIHKIDPIVPGETLTITGETNLRVGNELLIEVLSSTFGPTKKTQTGEFAGGSKSVKVVQGTSLNTFSVEFDTAGYIVDEYIVQATGVVTDVSTARSFDVVAATPTPTVTPTTTKPATTYVTPTRPTTAPTTKPTTTPTESPGFGAVIALAGLGAVAYLTVRKN